MLGGVCMSFLWRSLCLITKIEMDNYMISFSKLKGKLMSSAKMKSRMDAKRKVSLRDVASIAIPREHALLSMTRHH